MTGDFSQLGVSVELGQYLLAVFGSAVVEVAALLKELSAHEGQLPAKWKTRAYPVVRVAFAIIAAGPLAVFLDANTIQAAFYVGLSAPLIFDRAAAGLNVIAANGENPKKE